MVTKTGVVRGALGFALAALLSVAQNGSAQDLPRGEPPSAGAGRLWDAGLRLSPRARVEVERHLATAARRVGSPVYLFITDRLHQESATRMAERVFVDRALDGSGTSNPVLLLVAVSDGAAAIATGKGNAGIIPEMDATRITGALIAHRLGHDLQRPLTRAIDEIAEAGEATAARRRPLSVQDDDLPPADPAPGPVPPATTTKTDNETDNATDHATGDVAASQVPGAPGDNGRPSTEGPLGSEIAGRENIGDGPPANTPPPASRLPMALGVAALILLGLALRRRRSLKANRPEPPPSLREKPRLPSTIDRPTPTTRGRRR